MHASVIFASSLIALAGCGGSSQHPASGPDASPTQPQADADVPVDAADDAPPDPPGIELTYAISGIDGATGTLVATPAGTSCGPGCLRFAPGTAIQLTTSPAAGFFLYGWTGDCAGRAASCDLVMDVAHTVGTTFSPANKVFITSGTFVPSPTDTVGWADATCQTAATNAGLSGHFIGWIGAGSAPAEAAFETRLGATNGWVRIDGLPFAASRAALHAGHSLYPIVVDEHGTVVAPTTLVNSGLGYDCNGWTQTSGGFTVPGSAGGGWAGAAIYDPFQAPTCGTPMAMYCFQTDYDVTVTYARTPGRIAFVANGARSGADDVAGLDAACTQQASAAGLPGTYLALVATTTATAASRFSGSLGTQPWVRTDGVAITATASDLFADPPVRRAAMNIDAVEHPIFPVVIIGAYGLNAVADASSNCSDFADHSSTARVADAYPSEAGAQVFAGGISQCDQNLGVYCLQQ